MDEVAAAADNDVAVIVVAAVGRLSVLVIAPSVVHYVVVMKNGIVC